jgi:[ribosomal protein S18]-alanine N-acetyltransferase
VIAQLDRSHIEAILKIERKCFSEPWTRPMFEGEFENPVSHLWGWFERPGSDLLGYLVGWLVFEEFHIANLGIRPDSRRKGIARSLLDFSLIWAVEKEAERALLEVRASNAAALSLYRSAGFSLISVRPHYYRFPTEDALGLLKRLPCEPHEDINPI